MNFLKRFAVATMISISALAVGSGAAFADAGIQAEGGSSTTIQNGTGLVTVRWSADSTHTIWWGEGSFTSTLGIGNPKIRLTFFDDAGKIFDESEATYSSTRFGETHHRDINLSTDRNIVTVCAAVFEGATYLDRACDPITP
ncbi:hypothetical protein [Amycolatopsis magusensis]|uniref:hypothetical protein n=1 Tax=Amycolatopsis magusensis TaxID=882444 RepID=UPI0037BCBF7D